MDDFRLPKQLLFGELSTGRRPIGRPKLRFKDTCKESMLNMNIDHTSWELLATDRSAWRQAVALGASALEEQLRTERDVKRQRRKEALPPPPNDETLRCRFCGRPCSARIGLISHERHCDS